MHPSGPERAFPAKFKTRYSVDLDSAIETTEHTEDTETEERTQIRPLAGRNRLRSTRYGFNSVSSVYSAYSVVPPASTVTWRN